MNLVGQQFMVICLLLCLLNQVSSKLVIVEVFDANYHNESLEVCALYYTHGPLQYFSKYKLKNLNTFDFCSSYFTDGSGSFDRDAVFFRCSPPFSCTIKEMADNLAADQIRLGLIGSDGPFNLSRVSSNNKVGLVFIPYSSALKVENKIRSVNDSYIRLDMYKNQFDWSIVITLAKAMLIVVIMGLWNLYKFKKAIRIKKAKYDQKLKERTEMTSVSKQVDESNLSNSSTHPSIDELPTPFDDQETTGQKTTTTDNNNNKSSRSNFNDKAGDNLKKFTSLFKKREHFVDVSVGYVALLVTFFVLCGLVVLVYFFYYIMSWVLSVIFALMACVAMYTVISRIIDTTRLLQFRIPENNIPILKKRPQVLRMFAFLAILVFCGVWLAFRQKHWAWILQDIMVLFLVKYALLFNMFRSYKMIIVMLVLFMIYDTFMIFILPLIAKHATMMTSVAFGFRTSYDSWYEQAENKNIINFNQKYEQNWLPFYLIIPNTSHKRRLCYDYFILPYTMLGIGDILVSALSFNYGLIYDIAKSRRCPIYFFVNLGAHTLGLFLLGLVATFVETNLPPMLFMSPVLITANITTALVFKELNDYLTGRTISNYKMGKIMGTK